MKSHSYSGLHSGRSRLSRRSRFDGLEARTEGLSCKAGPESTSPSIPTSTSRCLVAIGIGVTLGCFDPSLAAAMKPLGDGFIKLIKMMIAPIIFTTVVVGIAKIGDMKKVGRVGLKALIYFELVTTLALAIGLVVVNVVRPGAGINADVETLDTKGIAAYTAGGKPLSTVDLLLHIIPDSAVGAFASGEILQVLTFSVLFGLALGAARGRRGDRWSISSTSFRTSSST